METRGIAATGKKMGKSQKPQSHKILARTLLHFCKVQNQTNLNHIFLDKCVGCKAVKKREGTKTSYCHEPGGWGREAAEGGAVMEEVVIRRKSKPLQMDDGNTSFINGAMVCMLFFRL